MIQLINKILNIVGHYLFIKSNNEFLAYKDKFQQRISEMSRNYEKLRATGSSADAFRADILRDSIVKAQGELENLSAIHAKAQEKYLG